MKPLIDIVWPADEFAARDIPPRPWMVEGVIPEPSIGLLSAYRGCGKTLVAKALGIGLARGSDWLGYNIVRPVDTLYIEGEMPLPDLRQRLVVQSGPEGAPSNFYILASEDMACEHISINLAEKEDRDTILKSGNGSGESGLLVDLARRNGRQIGMVILDNWTSLVHGIDENSNSELDPIKQWLIRLRHYETSVLIVHHHGESGRQRGASAREDLIDYSIKLTGRNGLSGLEWDKSRTIRPDPYKFGLGLVEDEKWLKIVRSNRVSPKGPAPKHDAGVLDWLKENGPAGATEIAEALGLERNQVVRAIARGLLNNRVTKLADGQYCM